MNRQSRGLAPSQPHVHAAAVDRKRPSFYSCPPPSHHSSAQDPGGVTSSSPSDATAVSAANLEHSLPREAQICARPSFYCRSQFPVRQRHEAWSATAVSLSSCREDVSGEGPSCPTAVAVRPSFYDRNRVIRRVLPALNVPRPAESAQEGEDIANSAALLEEACCPDGAAFRISCSVDEACSTRDSELSSMVADEVEPSSDNTWETPLLGGIAAVLLEHTAVRSPKSSELPAPDNLAEAPELADEMQMVATTSPGSSLVQPSQLADHLEPAEPAVETEIADEVQFVPSGSSGPADVTQPVETVEPAESSEQSVLDRPAEVVELVDGVRLESAESLSTGLRQPPESIELAEQAELLELVEQEQPVERAGHIEPAESLEAAVLAQPVTGVEPADAADAIDVATSPRQVQLEDSVLASETVSPVDERQDCLPSAPAVATPAAEVSRLAPGQGWLRHSGSRRWADSEPEDSDEDGLASTGRALTWSLSSSRNLASATASTMSSDSPGAASRPADEVEDSSARPREASEWKAPQTRSSRGNRSGRRRRKQII